MKPLLVEMIPIDVVLCRGPLPLHPAVSDPCEGTAGALICFDGIVRREEDGRDLCALAYEAYSPMSEQQLQQLAEQIVEEFSLLALSAQHSVGVVPVGECSFRLRIASKHRKEGIAACDAFIDRMKKVVPLWKVPVYMNSNEG